MVLDIFRFVAEGKIAEYGDNLAAKAQPNPSGWAQTDGTMEKQLVDREAVRRVVAAFVGGASKGACATLH